MTAQSSDRQARFLDTLRDLPGVRNPRRIGTILAFELDDGTGNYLSELGPRLMGHFRERDLLVRPLGNTIYTMPPYCIDEPDLAQVQHGITEALDRFATGKGFG